MKVKQEESCPHIILSSYRHGTVQRISFESASIVWVAKSSCNCSINFNNQIVMPNTMFFFNKGETFSCTNNDLAQIEILNFNSEVFSSSTTIINSVFNSLLQDNKENHGVVFSNQDQATFIDTIFENIQRSINTSSKQILKR